MMALRLVEDARRPVLTWAAGEARRRGDRRIGTVHLLLGLLHDADSEAARVLGVDLASARAAESALDRTALAAVGIEVSDLNFAVESPDQRGLLPLTSGARAVLQRTIQEASPKKTGRIAVRHLLLALLTREAPDPAAELLEALGVDVLAVRDRLADPARRNAK